MNWKYKPGECVTWQATHKKVGDLDTGYVISYLPATKELSSPRSSFDQSYAKKAAEILSELGFEKPDDFFERKLKPVSATSQQNRYLIWVPSPGGKSGKFQTPVKSVVERYSHD